MCCHANHMTCCILSTPETTLTEHLLAMRMTKIITEIIDIRMQYSCVCVWIERNSTITLWCYCDDYWLTLQCWHCCLRLTRVALFSNVTASFLINSMEQILHNEHLLIDNNMYSYTEVCFAQPHTQLLGYTLLMAKTFMNLVVTWKFKRTHNMLPLRKPCVYIFQCSHLTEKAKGLEEIIKLL